MSLNHPPLFFDRMRAGVLGPTLDDGEVKGCNAILAAMEGAPLADTAYALATAYRETAGTMQPVAEANWLSEAARQRWFLREYDIAGARPDKAKRLGNLCAGDGCKFCGRGYVQITGRSNYQRASDKLGVDLIADPDKAMRPDIAAKIMRQGMDGGWFTTKSFRSYLPAKGTADRAAFAKARYIINGQDHAGEIADAALQFQSALQAGGWA